MNGWKLGLLTGQKIKKDCGSSNIKCFNAFFGGIVIAIYHLFTVCGDVSKKQMVTKNV
jgi:hypothetical protein